MYNVIVSELSKDDCFVSKDSCALSISNASHLDNKPMFFLPDPGSGDGLKLQSDLHSQPGGGAFPSTGYRLDPDIFSSSIKFDGSAPGIEFSDIQKTSVALPDTTNFSNGDGDPSAGLFALTNMEWSDLELDLMNVHMDTGPFKDQSIGDSSMGFVDSRLPDAVDSHFNDISLDGHQLPLDINPDDWLNMNNSSAPVFSFNGSSSSTGTGQYPNEEYLMMPRPSSDTLDLFNIDESELYMTPDLSAVMAFEKLIEAQTSKT